MGLLGDDLQHFMIGFTLVNVVVIGMTEIKEEGRQNSRGSGPEQPGLWKYGQGTRIKSSVILKHRTELLQV